MAYNTWIRWCVLAGWAVSMSGCLEVAVIQSLGEDSDRDDVDCGDYECEDGYDESAPADWDESYADETWDDEEYYEEEWTEQPVTITDSSLAGDMGQVRGFSDEDPMHSGYGYLGWATVEIHATGRNGTEAAMAIFEIDGGIDHPGLVPGAHYEFSLETYEWDQRYDTPLRMDVIGCAGPSEGDWVFDTGADEVVVDVSQGSTPDTITIGFTATFSNYADYDGYGDLERQIVTGSFETNRATHAD